MTHLITVNRPNVFVGYREYQTGATLLVPDDVYSDLVAAKRFADGTLIDNGLVSTPGTGGTGGTDPNALAKGNNLSDLGNFQTAKVNLSLDQVNNTSDVNKPVSNATALALSGKADLSNGVVPTSQLPAISIDHGAITVANASARYALVIGSNVEPGQPVVQASTGQTFILIDGASDASQSSQWVEIPAIGKVQSVNGGTGQVVLSAGDVNAPSLTAFSGEVTRAQTAEQANTSAINAEKTRAQGVEQANATAIGNEVTRAQTAEQANASAITVNASAVTAETSRAQGAEALLMPVLDLLPTSTTSKALTQGKIQPFNASGGAISVTALPVLSTVPLFATYGVEKAEASTNPVTVPFASGDTTLTGLTSLVMQVQGTVYLQALSNPSGGKYWKVVNHIRSDVAFDTRYDLAGAAATETTRAVAAESAVSSTVLYGGLTFITRTADPNNYTYPGKIKNPEPGRRRLVIQNLGVNSVQVALKNSDPSDSNAPTTAQWAAGEIIAAGQESVQSASTLTMFIRPATSGQAVTCSIYSEAVS